MEEIKCNFCNEIIGKTAKLSEDKAKDLPGIINGKIFRVSLNHKCKENTNSNILYSITYTQKTDE